MGSPAVWIQPTAPNTFENLGLKCDDVIKKDQEKVRLWSAATCH